MISEGGEVCYVHTNMISLLLKDHYEKYNFS